MRRTSVVDSIREVEPTAWDALTDNVLCRHGWLRTLEETYTAAPAFSYFLVHDGDRLVGTAVGHQAADKEGILTLDDIVYGKHKRRASMLGLSLLPYLHCGAMSSYGDHFAIDATLPDDERTAVAGELLDALEQVAATRTLPLYLNNLLADEAPLLGLLDARGYRTTNVAPLCYLDIEWDSFEGYLGYLRGISRNMARGAVKEIRRGLEAGVRIERAIDAERHAERLQELADQQWRRHNDRPFPFRDFFPRALANLRERLVLYGAFKDDRLIGFSMLIRDRGVAWGLEVGIDDEHRREAATYFNLCYYRPVEDAIRERTRRIYFGRGLPGVKLRRGCRTGEVRLAYRARSRLAHTAIGLLFRVQSARTRTKLERSGAGGRPR